MTDTHIPETAIEQVVDAIINSRDFCGNERLAAIEAAQELGFAGRDMGKLIRIANFRANKRWNSFKKAAGVSAKHCF